MNRSANRPGSQHMGRFRNFELVATVCRFPRAADGDRPRSEGMGSWSQCMREGERGLSMNRESMERRPPARRVERTQLGPRRTGGRRSVGEGYAGAAIRQGRVFVMD
jgi:hypothetical protein